MANNIENNEFAGAISSPQLYSCPNPIAPRVRYRHIGMLGGKKANGNQTPDTSGDKKREK